MSLTNIFFAGRRKVLGVALATAALALAGCGQQGGGAAPAAGGAAQDKLVIKVGHAATEDNTGHKGLVRLSELLQERTNGRISLQIFGNSQLGNERELIEAIQLGSVGMAFVSSAPVGSFKKEFFALDLPFVFTDRAKLYSILDGDIGKSILGSLDSINIKGLGFWENGFRQLSNNKIEVHKLEDIKGLKIRTIENEVHLAIWKALGANPAPLAFGELFTALQQGTFEAQETPINLFYDMKYYEVQKFISTTRHLYGAYVVLLNKDIFDKLSDEDKAILATSFADAQKYQRDLAATADDKAIEAMPMVKITNLSDDEIAVFRSHMDPVYALIKERAGEEIVNKILEAAK